MEIHRKIAKSDFQIEKSYEHTCCYACYYCVVIIKNVLSFESLMPYYFTMSVSLRDHGTLKEYSSFLPSIGKIS